MTYYRIVDGYEAHSKPVLQRLHVVRRTARGCWVVHSWAWPLSEPVDTREALRRIDAHHVLDGSGRRYAYPTVAAALDSYLRRKHRQIQHAKAAIERAEYALDWCSRSDVEDETVTFADPVPVSPWRPNALI